MIVSINYYLASAILEESVKRANGTHQLTLIKHVSDESTTKFKLLNSEKIINVETKSINAWNFKKPFLLNQYDFGKLIKLIDKQSITGLEQTNDKILSVHKVRKACLSIKDEEVWLLVDSFYGKRNSLIVLENVLYEFPKTGTFFKNELNPIAKEVK